jgi:hypothetical protein
MIFFKKELADNIHKPKSKEWWKEVINKVVEVLVTKFNFKVEEVAEKL